MKDHRLRHVITSSYDTGPGHGNLEPVAASRQHRLEAS